MNVLPGVVSSINVKGDLSVVRVDVGPIKVTAIVVDTPETKTYLRAGASLHVIFKETEVIIGKGTDHRISLRNKFIGRISEIESGDLLARLTVDTSVGPIVSVITSNAVRQLELKKGSEVTAMVKTNEMMLSE